ncbi:M23 family metallopeptidase [Geomesophilobacter sediminis]|uniref:M23 family metallopeptidase n=1 Tax=Geomesophilobacter sediminis TaxID=2798584 RepID=A0A8J7IP89_9BACT|nr:M23 family metallopeptidase [Geomesophilobacter sediminis]MBJ6725313.1 M23 family metallopeptidase [Geomesophilobacter sediminis]
MKTSAMVILLVLLAVVIVGGVYLFLGGTGPLVTVTPSSGAISAKQSVVVALKAVSGLKELTVSAVQGQQPFQLVNKKYPEGVKEARETLNLAPAGVKDGPVTLVVRVNDRSIARFGAGHTTELSHQFVFDSKPPAISILSTAHNIARGGVGLVVYSVNKELQRSGIVFADRFFPGYRQKSGNYACLFAFPYDMPEEQFVPKVLAVDKAGNERRAGIYFHLIPKTFRSDRIELTDSFLDKVANEFAGKYSGTPLEVYLKVNREERLQNLKTLRECGLKTAADPLWKDAFLRLPNSAPRGGFGQHRTYFYKGKEVDQQTHLGVDLAALSHVPIPAANSGKVVYADYLGIYGQCIIIDHGMGLQSIYGHLSQIGVKVGDQVEKAAIIGRSGDTGLAGGDHLHFGIAVSGEQVNPIEWWDQKWIRDNIYSKMEQ